MNEQAMSSANLLTLFFFHNTCNFVVAVQYLPLPPEGDWVRDFLEVQHTISSNTKISVSLCLCIYIQK